MSGGFSGQKKKKLSISSREMGEKARDIKMQMWDQGRYVGTEYSTAAAVEAGWDTGNIKVKNTGSEIHHHHRSLVGTVLLK